MYVVMNHFSIEERSINHLLLNSKAKNMIAAFGTDRAMWIPIPSISTCKKKVNHYTHENIKNRT